MYKCRKCKETLLPDSYYKNFRGMCKTCWDKYFALHAWVKEQLGLPDTCEKCGRSGLTGHSIHWANKSGEYKKEIVDWLRLCSKCHKNYDLNPSMLKQLSNMRKLVKYPTRQKCNTKDCIELQEARGLCKKHYSYQYWKSHYSKGAWEWKQ